ncbi:MlaD family protein [Oxalobacter sp. OttesenSCG-928-P03]|nr:MlaD family protein [Oxalobacter sp. OttesenSCG-928-P03]
MESKSHALMAGLFTLALLAAVLLGGWWLNRDKTEMIPYVMATRLSVAGLSPQAAVRYRGLDVGKVSEIRFDSAVPGQILVFFGVRPETPMTESTYGMLAYQGVTGIAYVELNDDGSRPQPLPSSETRIAQIEMRAGLMADLQTKANAILDETQKLTKEMAGLFKPENQEILINTLKSINKAATEIEKSSRNLQPTLAKLPGLADKTGQMMDSVTALSNELGDLSQNLTSFVGNSNTAESMTQLHSLAEDLHTSLQSLNNTLDQFSQRPAGLLFGAPGPNPGPGEAGYRASPN